MHERLLDLTMPIVFVDFFFPLLIITSFFFFPSFSSSSALHFFLLGDFKGPIHCAQMVRDVIYLSIKLSVY